MAFQDTIGRLPQQSRLTALVNNPFIRGVVFQVVLIVALIWIGWEFADNAARNLRAQGIVSGFGFLKNATGFDIIQALIPYSEGSSYGRALLVGFLNTLLVAVIGIVCTTVLGFTLGIARLSRNWIVRKIATVYVEIIRNVPLLLQIFFWYFAVLRSVPGQREKWSFLFDSVHVNIAGLHGPKPVFSPGAGTVGIALLLGIFATAAISSWANRRRMATGQGFPTLRVGLALVLGLPLLVYLVTGMPIGLDYPVFSETGPILRRGFQPGTGFVLLPEFLSLVLALTIYTAAFIAENVRSGILAVSHGQTEASYSLGLRPGRTLRLVIIPQAMRVIIPPLTSQYLNLTKNSSLAVAIAYPDIVLVGRTIFSQTGQSVIVITIWMVVYLSLSLITSAFMNWYNSRIALVER